MSINFQNNPFKKLNFSNNLIRYIDSNSELSLVIIKGNKFDSYKLVPKVFKYKNEIFYINCKVNNTELWIPYNNYILIDNYKYGIFEDVESGLEIYKELNNE